MAKLRWVRKRYKGSDELELRAGSDLVVTVHQSALNRRWYVEIEDADQVRLLKPRNEQQACADAYALWRAWAQGQMARLHGQLRSAQPTPLEPRVLRKGAQS